MTTAAEWPDTFASPRELVKEFLRFYVERGDTTDEITEGHMGWFSRDYGVEISPTHLRKDYPRSQVVVMKFEKRPCLHVFSVAELIAELKALSSASVAVAQPSLWE